MNNPGFFRPWRLVVALALPLLTIACSAPRGTSARSAFAREAGGEPGFLALEEHAARSLHSASAVAVEARPPQGMGGPDDDSFLKSKLTYWYSDDAGFDDGAGEVSFSALDVSAELPFLELKLGRYELDWTNAESLPFANGSSDPIASLNSVELSLRAPVPLTENLALHLGVGVTAAYEDEMSNSYSENGMLGFAWKASKNIDVLVAGMYSFHPDVDRQSPFFPMVGISWNQDTEHGWSAALGVPTEIRYVFNKHSSIALGGSPRPGGLFRLSDDSPIAPAGFIEVNPFGLGIEYKYQLGSRVSFDLGVHPFSTGKWYIYDSSGDRISTEEPDSALGLSFGLSFGL